MQDGIINFSEMLVESRRATIFVGTGISTEYGIPDFRSPAAFGLKTSLLISANSWPPRKPGERPGGGKKQLIQCWPWPNPMPAIAPSPDCSS